METEVSRKIGHGFDSRGCLDFDEFLESNREFGTCQTVGFQNAGKQVNSDLSIDVDGQFTEMHGSSDPTQTWTSRRHDLRRSLAWDTAFFTSAGVLELEELSRLIIGAEKGDKHLLPGIQEDMGSSIESLSTLESDNFNLETFEDDLFVDIRASTVRSSKKMPNLTIPHQKKADVEVAGAPIISLEKEGVVSQNKNAKPRLGKTNELQTNSKPRLNVVKQGSGKAVKHDAGRSHSQIGNKSPIITSKSRTTGRPITTTPLRGSIGTGLNKSEYGTLKHASTSSKGTDGATRLLPRPALSPKLSLSGFSTTTRFVRSTTSHPSGGGCGVSAGNNTKSQLVMARRVPGRSSIEDAGSMLKRKPASSTLSAYLRSTKISSSVTPASSVSKWSSVSSSSSSAVTNNTLQFDEERSSLDSCSCRSIDGDINLGCQKRSPLAEQVVNESMNQAVNIPFSNSKNSTPDGIALALVKPSRLRPPSPKHGFFDGVKSSTCTPNRNQLSQLGSPCIFLKNGTFPCNSPSCGSNMTSKCAKLTTSSASMSSTRERQNSPQPASAKSSQGKMYRSQSDISTLTGVKGSPSLYQNIRGGEGLQTHKKVLREGTVTSEMNLHENMGSRHTLKRDATSVEVIDWVLDKLVNQCLREDEKENAHNKYRSICELKCKLSDTSDGTATKRSPFATKNKFCINGSNELATQTATDKTPFPFPCDQKENH